MRVADSSKRRICAGFWIVSFGWDGTSKVSKLCGNVFIILSLIIGKVIFPSFSNIFKIIGKSILLRGKRSRKKSPSFDFSQYFVLNELLSVLVSLL